MKHLLDHKLDWVCFRHDSSVMDMVRLPLATPKLLGCLTMVLEKVTNAIKEVGKYNLHASIH